MQHVIELDNDLSIHYTGGDGIRIEDGTNLLILHVTEIRPMVDALVKMADWLDGGATLRADIASMVERLDRLKQTVEEYLEKVAQAEED